MSTGFNEEEPHRPRVYKRRAYPEVAIESVVKAAVSESELENYPNGSAGITGCARLFRMVIRTANNFMDRNSRNIAAIPGAKWRRLDLRDILTDQGCAVGSDCDLSDVDKCCGDPTF
jgi:hypothetical protein